MYVDKKLLRSKMYSSGHNITSLAETTGINRDTISNVLNGKTAPSYPVMNSIFYELKLTPQEAIDIFFSNKLRKKKVGSL
ncbi:XRE family transcriptional regulator [Staphylococcus xylosus]|uniref:helix-turn-helix domain-containing protein n=1 Tax=Staphylococcus xylosus TaxID=1288 RepID=UPI000E6956C6|nr:helix-turn-helix transcriptional regulator [Staphylococcus xylosus]RIM86017.1 XRE family transcriptional regulator [Staphylococcus xylosus]